MKAYDSDWERLDKELESAKDVDVVANPARGWFWLGCLAVDCLVSLVRLAEEVYQHQLDKER